MRYLSIKNFDKHQHYKDRRPPWIKLHAEVLDDYAFSCLQDASKAHLMLLWVLASKLDNRIPYDLAFIARQIGATSPVDVEELVLQGFIAVSQDDSAALAPRKRSAMPEAEAEAEAKREAKGSAVAAGASAPSPPAAAPAEAPAAVDPPVWLRCHAAWERYVGPVDKARFRRALRPVCEPDGEPIANVGMLVRAIEWYAAIRKHNAREWSFVKPEQFAAGIRAHLDVARMPVEERLRLLPMAGAA